MQTTCPGSRRGWFLVHAITTTLAEAGSHHPFDVDRKLSSALEIHRVPQRQSRFELHRETFWRLRNMVQVEGWNYLLSHLEDDTSRISSDHQKGWDFGILQDDIRWLILILISSNCLHGWSKIQKEFARSLAKKKWYFFVDFVGFCCWKWAKYAYYNDPCIYLLLWGKNKKRFDR